MSVLKHFGLREQPFGVTPDSRFLFGSPSHREALASIIYGLESGLGFVLLVAKPGMGKTTLVFEVLRRLRETTKQVFIFQTIQTPTDLLQAILMDLGVKEIKASLVEMQAQLNEVLVAETASGKRLIVAIDEAQNLDESVLEAVRMLSNFETSRQKLIQFVLSGQLQLADKIALPRLLQLRQRISIFSYLKPLTASEVAEYIQHRLRIAGCESPEALYDQSALALISEYSDGIPRNINNICFNSLSIGYALQRKVIDRSIVGEVISDLHLDVHEDTTKASAPILLKTVKEAVNPTVRPSLERSFNRKAVLLSGVLTALLAMGWISVKNRWADVDVHPQSRTKEGRSTEQPKSVAILNSSQVISNSANSSASPNASVVNAIVPLELNTQDALVIPTRSILVKRGQSLYGICVEVFGECRPKTLREMIEMNSSISDPGHIEPGQTISVPTTAKKL